MEELSTDILVIGSGLAGIVSALEAERSAQKVLIVGKFSIGMGTNTSMANGAFTAANSRFSREEHLRATLESGKGLNHVKVVRALVENGTEAMKRLEAYGVPMVERGIGYLLARPEGSSQLPGVLLVRALAERLKRSTVTLLPGAIVFDLIVEEGEVRGAFGFFRDGRPYWIEAKSVVLATGGAGAIYQRNDNQKSILGDGYALALRAGLPLFDLEFVQFYPFVLAEPRLSTFILLPPYPEEARLLNDRGEDLAERLGIRGDFNRAIIAERDRVSIALYEASRGGDVYFDFRQVPEERWNRYPLNFLKKSKFPFRERPFLISPAVHFFMGGVETDEGGKTALPGLFAAGEVAWGVHGANRLGGNALTEAAVFGAIAGRSAAEYARIKGREGIRPDLSERLKRKCERKAKAYLRRRKGTFDHPKDLFKELRNLAWKYAGPAREGSLLKEGLDCLTSVEKRIEKVYPATPRDLFAKRDLENIALLLKAILKGSLLREESRGSFYRKDFPDQDDQNWMKNTCYRLSKEELQITHRPVKSVDDG